MQVVLCMYRIGLRIGAMDNRVVQQNKETLDAATHALARC